MFKNRLEHFLVKAFPLLFFFALHEITIVLPILDVGLGDHDKVSQNYISCCQWLRHIINSLLTSQAQSVQGNIFVRSFESVLGTPKVKYFLVRTSRSVNIVDIIVVIVFVLLLSCTV